MKLQELEIKNFRCFEKLNLLLNGDSLFFISENGGGKTALLSALAMALGRDRPPVLTDFRDPNVAIEITATLVGFDANQRADLANAIDFNNPPTLKIGVVATWDAAAELVDATQGFPTHNWRRPTREERDSLGFLWLPASRDVTRLTSFSARISVLRQILEGLPINAPLQTVLNEIRSAISSLTIEPELTKLFGKMRSYLAKILPGVPTQAYNLGSSAVSDRELLRQLELLLSYEDSPFIAADRQSSGLAQLTVFALINELSATNPAAIFAVDEPETSLHPHAQRALYIAIAQLPNQALVSTHSSNLMERVDPRKVVRLGKKNGQIVPIRPSALSNEEAAALSRYSSPETAEALFAKRVIFVEGPADRLALASFAAKTSRLLDQLGISIIALNSADTLGAFLKLFGPPGFDLPVCGLCDADHQSQWAEVLEKVGFGVNLTAAQHRCARKIVELGNRLIRSYPLSSGRQMKPHKQGGKVRYAQFHDKVAEAEKVSAEIQDLILSGAKPSQFAILVRASYRASSIVENLESAGLPVARWYGPGYDTQARKAVETCLSVARGRLSERQIRRLCDLLGLKDTGERVTTKVLAAGKSLPAVRPLTALNESVWKGARPLELLVHAKNCIAQVKPKLQNSIDQIIDSVKIIEAHDPEFNLDQLLSELALGGISGSPTQGNTIKVATLHKAKGLQWPNVTS